VHAPVATAVLQARGAGAVAAANAAGVPSSTASVSSPNLVCDGDGTTGNRVQAMYVVEAGQPDRYAAMLPSFKLWAAGVDAVFNRSAAMTGGVRNLRWVTEGTAPSCTAQVLDVTVPAGSLATLTTQLAAVRALGYTDQHRKYLMWTDANVYCGIATLYVDPRPTQANFNNGYAASFSRVDTGCWGFGASSFEGHPVEAHELSHNLGAVQPTAPHGTTNDHCTTSFEVMCYPDSGDGIHPLMTYTCPVSFDALLDCNGVDYYNTAPAPGSYLASNWDNTSSQFLIGGGDGVSSSGSVGSLGAAVTMNNPVMPGLGTQVSVAVRAPAGDAHTTTWSSEGPGCAVAASVGNPDQGTLTCDASTATSPTQVTATVTDTTTGVTTYGSSSVLFSATARALTLALTVNRTPAPGIASACKTTPNTLTAKATDFLTGTPAQGVDVTFTSGTTVLGQSMTAADGTATLALATLPAGALSITAPAGPGFAVATSPAVNVMLYCGRAVLTAALSPVSVAPGDRHRRRDPPGRPGRDRHLPDHLRHSHHHRHLRGRRVLRRVLLRDCDRAGQRQRHPHRRHRVHRSQLPGHRADRHPARLNPQRAVSGRLVGGRIPGHQRAAVGHR
jgi:hypothetical protein